MRASLPSPKLNSCRRRPTAGAGWRRTRCPPRVDWNTRLVTGDAATEITRLKAEDAGPMDIGGATLAGAAMRAGLIDEYVLVTMPVLVGGGTPFFTALESWVT
ncbi:dihydrofolate reductase family protein [Asanoa sp. NPDC050611]|uniref:dihydrofolate reductase family protein n=1 Tax=Asanoa sp. NPDC050611 TaxID=3157098 RepID=UPI0033D99947